MQVPEAGKVPGVGASTGSKGPQRRRRGFYAAIVGFAILGVICILLVLLTLSPGERFLKGIVERRLVALAGQQVSIGRLETNLLSRFRLADLRIYEIQDGDTLASVNLGSVRVRYSLAGLVRRHLDVDSLSVDGLLLRVRKDSAGTYNFPFLKAEQKPDTAVAKKSSFTVTLGRADITESRFYYTDRYGPDLDIAATGLGATVSGQGTDRYAFEVRLDSVSTEYDGVPVDISSIALAGIWDHGRLKVDTLMAYLPGLRLGGSLDVAPKGGAGSLDGGFWLRGNPRALLQHLAAQSADSLIPVDADLDLVVDLTGSLKRPEAQVDLRISKLDIARLHIPEARLRASARPESVRVDEFRARLLGGTCSAHATIMIDSLLSFRSSVLIEGIDVVQLGELASSRSMDYQGRINGSLTAAGKARLPTGMEISGDLGVEQASYKGKAVAGIEVSLGFKGGVADLQLAQAGSKITATVVVDDRILDGRFAVHIADLEHLTAMFVPDLAGRFEAHGSVNGIPESLFVDVRIDSARIRYQNFPIDSLYGDIRYDAGTVHLAGLRFAGGLARIDTLRPPLNLTGIRGGFDYRGTVSGALDSPSGQVLATMHGIEYGKAGFDTGSVRVTLGAGKVDLTSFEIQRDSLRVRGSGSYLIPDERGQLNLEILDLSSGGEPQMSQPAEPAIVTGKPTGTVTASFDLSRPDDIAAAVIGDGIRLEPLISVLAGEPGGRGTLDFTAHVSGSPKQPEARLGFTLWGPGYKAASIDSAIGQVVLADRQLRIAAFDAYTGATRHTFSADVALESAEGGGYTVSDESSFRGRVVGEDFDLRLVGWLLPDNARMEGLVSYDVRWDGTLREPHPRGTLELTDGRFGLEGEVSAVSGMNMSTAFDDSVITVKHFRGLAKDTPFDVQAVIVASRWRTFDVDLSASLSTYGQVSGQGMVSADSLDFVASVNQLDLSVFEPLSPDLTRLSGMLTSDIVLQGPVRAPRVRGVLRIDGLYVEAASFDPPVSDGVVRLSFEGETVNIDSVFARMGKGYAYVSGKLSHKGGRLAQASIAVEVDQIEFNRPDMVEVLVESADLRFAGEAEKYLLDGDLVMGKTRFIMDIDTRSILPFARSVGRPEQELPAVLTSTTLDVRLRDSKDLWVDNNVARLRSHAELNIIGLVSQPNATGRLTIDEGYIRFLDRKFEMTKGIIDFVDRDRLNPIIDLSARSKIKTYKALKTTSYMVYLNIAGSLDQVRVDLTSDPPLDRGNILSLLTLGVTRDQLADSGTDSPTTGEVLKMRAEELTSRVVSGYITRSVADLVGLKDLSIEGNLFSPRGAEGPFLVASKDVSDRVEITYSTNIGHFNRNAVKMDYRFSRRFSVEGETDQQGHAGINLKYKVTYP